VDKDTVSVSNINRQLIATHKTIGIPKVEVMRDRILDINPAAEVEICPTFFNNETAGSFDLSQFSYVADAIDTISSKLILIEKSKSIGVPIISCMGAGNKLDPSRFEVADIYKTSVCPLARIIRYELRQRGIKDLKVVYSKEAPITPENGSEDLPDGKRQLPGSISFVPSVAGLIMAGEIIRDIAGF
jgi:tRNA A37 threonylcarbamoyladenosine dehydratase